jgi:hypothetical protein
VSTASPARQRRASRSPPVQTPAERQLRQDLTRLVNELVEDAVQRALANALTLKEGKPPLALFGAIGTAIERTIVDHETRLHAARA